MTPENKTILPDEIKKWIEETSEAVVLTTGHKPKETDYVYKKRLCETIATSMYQHLSKQLTEKDREILKLKEEYNKLYRRFMDSLPDSDY